MSIPTLTFIDIRPRRVAALLVLLAVAAAASRRAQAGGRCPRDRDSVLRLLRYGEPAATARCG